MTLHPLLRVQALEKTYGAGAGAVRALDGVSLDVPRGQFVAIMGPSGSGKSTLMQCAAGLDTVDAGQVFLDGDELTAMRDDQLTVTRRDRIGFIFQAFNLLPTLNARDNISLPLTMAKRGVDKQWFDHVVAMLGLKDRLAHCPTELSGGQQQRVAVARALITQPDIIFADEPTGALDQATSETLMQFLRRLSNELGQTLIMVTHDQAAAKWSDRIIELCDGRVTHDTALSQVS
ncbi:Macrolide export ATP-binding/permease protein MacB [Corynebacterium glaucum]|uniref:ABC transporter ATP-binding protein n=1 Tax=Corynebacterium glaucum TaxID=187491 RepID=UPI0025B5ECA2|nr:ABC transporter ATP-binding protein [Corynebacterium glaucum]WJZ08215.1 Macrolide export ATP-binding/permease protein MacB [Corynebacterium glaucum]